MRTKTSRQEKVQAPRHVFVESSKATTPAEHRAQVPAARFRMTLDQRLGRETPAHTQALAKEPS
jgi:hypothetical protein